MHSLDTILFLLEGEKMKTDILIVGSGVAGLYCALNLPREKSIIIVTKNKARRSDSYLAQGGICVLRDEKDYDAFYEDTMKAGHYENNPDSVHIMIHSSREVISDLISFGVRFEMNGKEFIYTKPLTSRLVRFAHPANIMLISVTLSVLNLLTSRLERFLHPANIDAILVTL